MHTKSLEILEKAELPNQQARAILEVMELELAMREEFIATKSDLREAFHTLEMRLESAKNELRGEIASLRVELVAKIESVRGEAKGIQGELMRWVLGCSCGVVVAIVGSMYFIVTHLKP